MPSKESQPCKPDPSALPQDDKTRCPTLIQSVLPLLDLNLGTRNHRSKPCSQILLLYSLSRDSTWVTISGMPNLRVNSSVVCQRELDKRWYTARRMDSGMSL